MPPARSSSRDPSGDSSGHSSGDSSRTVPMTPPRQEKRSGKGRGRGQMPGPSHPGRTKRSATPVWLPERPRLRAGVPTVRSMAPGQNASAAPRLQGRGRRGRSLHESPTRPYMLQDRREGWRVQVMDSGSPVRFRGKRPAVRPPGPVSRSGSRPTPTLIVRDVSSPSVL
jgi:hypothetical protein